MKSELSVFKEATMGSFLKEETNSLARIPTAFQSIASICKGRNYYVGGLVAITLNNLTDQQFYGNLDVFTDAVIRGRTFSFVNIKFHCIKPNLLLDGYRTIKIDGVLIKIATTEKIILDALMYPNVFGGRENSGKWIIRLLPKANIKKLIALALMKGTVRACQRLGAFLESENMPTGQLKMLRRRVVGKNKTFLTLPANYSKEINFSRKWHVEIEKELLSH